METTINVHQENLPVVPVKKPVMPVYSTDIFYNQQKGVEELIVEVIEQNIPQKVLEDLNEWE